MFGKFLKTPECMKVLSWLLNHPDDKYTAAIIAIECNMVDMSSFMAVLTTLEGVNLVTFDEYSEEDLLIGFNKDSSSGQLLIHLQDEFNDCAFKSEQVSPSLAYLHSPQLKKTVDAQIFKTFDANEVVDMCKNYKELDQSNEMEREIYNICSKLEETGEYEDFINKIENETKK